jgi:hypothetical protein
MCWERFLFFLGTRELCVWDNSDCHFAAIYRTSPVGLKIARYKELSDEQLTAYRFDAEGGLKKVSSLSWDSEIYDLVTRKRS